MNKKIHVFSACCKIMGNERGFILILALLMLVALTLAGGASLLMQTTEQYIVSNTEVAQNNFYAAEAVLVEAIVALKNADSDVLMDPKDTSADYRWVAPIDPSDSNWPPVDLSKNAQWYKSNPLVSPKETQLDSSKGNIVPPGYSSNGTVDGDRIWYAVMRGTINSDEMKRDRCKGSKIEKGQEEKCFTVYSMYDVKPDDGKTYTGQRMLMSGYRQTVYYNADE